MGATRLSNSDSLASFVDQFGHVQVAVRFGKFNVYAGTHRQQAGFRFVFGDEMAVRVGTAAQFPDRVVIGDDEAFEAPFPAEHIAQQPFAGVRRHAVNFIVRRHHTDGTGLLDRFFEWI